MTKAKNFSESERLTFLRAFTSRDPLLKNKTPKQEDNLPTETVDEDGSVRSLEMERLNEKLQPDELLPEKENGEREG